MQHGGEPEEAGGGAKNRGVSAPLNLAALCFTLAHEGNDHLHRRGVDALDGFDVESYGRRMFQQTGQAGLQRSDVGDRALGSESEHISLTASALDAAGARGGSR